jgi:hypothetical protein
MWNSSSKYDIFRLSNHACIGHQIRSNKISYRDPGIKVDISKNNSSGNKDRMGQLPDKDIQEKFQQQKNDVEAKFFVWFYINYGLELIIKILYI